MKVRFFCLLFLLAVLSACKKDVTTNAGSIYHTWEAKTFISFESVTYPKNEGKKILLTFNESGVYLLQLDINYCSGNFTVGDNKQLQIQSAGCSKACCDSKFSEKLVETLPKVASWQIEGNILRLNVPQWGYIQLKLAE